MDNWKHRSKGMLCRTCMYFVLKKQTDQSAQNPRIGRCRRNAPTLKGWPVMYEMDWCGEHKLDENKLEPVAE